MIIKKIIDGEVYKCSTSVTDFFTDDAVKQHNAGVCMEIMQDCLDTIYALVVKSYPKVFRPILYLADSEIQNAFAVEGKYIVITSGLVFQAANLLQQRYTQELLTKYDLLKDYSHEEILSQLRTYLWRFIILHELYHIWDGHHFWKKKYKFNKDGQIVTKLSDIDIPVISESENSDEIRKQAPVTDPQFNLTQQALELDADSAAVCMLVNLLMMDTEARGISNKNQHIKNHMAFIFGALSTTFCLFDGNSGAKFEVLNKLTETTHPIPAIRLVYAEEIADAILHHYCTSPDELRNVESEWQRILCDIEPEQNGNVDMGQVFYFTAHTEKAQRHLCAIKHRMHDMHDTLSQFILGNHADKLCEDEMSFIPESVWFTDAGISTKGWINPATGQQSAIKAKPKPIVKANKIGRNDPCPCGSGLKFKKCKCSQYHPQ